MVEPPRILTEVPESFTVHVNDTLEINVHVIGVPPPSITWRKDGVTLTGPRITITGSNFSLSDVQHSDAGVYTITAQNLAGMVQMNYSVFIRCKSHIK